MPVVRCACDCDKQWYHIPNTSARARPAAALGPRTRSLIPLLSLLFLPPPPAVAAAAPSSTSSAILLARSLFLSLSLVTRPRLALDTNEIRRRIRARFEGPGVRNATHKLRATRAYTREIFVAGIVVVFSMIPCDSAKERRESVAGTGIYVYIRTALTRSCDNGIFYCRPREHGLISSRF